MVSAKIDTPAFGSGEIQIERQKQMLMKNKTYYYAIGCPVEATLDLIGGKWKAVPL